MILLFWIIIGGAILTALLTILSVAQLTIASDHVFPVTVMIVRSVLLLAVAVFAAAVIYAVLELAAPGLGGQLSGT